jgi:hypothetical protein
MTRLKDRTLKKAYERQTLREGTTLLLEADQKVIQQIEQALAALSGITPDGAKIFETAIDAAKQELGKYLQGGIKQTFKNIFSDPVAKATTLANAIRTGLTQLPTIARLYLPKGGENETQKSIWEMVPPEKQKDLLASFTKAFKSDLSKGGLGGAMDLLKGNGLPYIANLQAAVQELLQNTNPQGGFKMGQQAAAQHEPPVQTADQPQDQNAPAQAPQQQATSPGAKPAMAASPAQTPKQPTQGIAPTPPKVAQTAVQTGSGAGATPAGAPPAQGQPAQQPGKGTGRALTATDTDKLKQMAYYVKSRSGVDDATAMKVVNALATAGALVDINMPQIPSKKLSGQAPAA